MNKKAKKRSVAAILDNTKNIKEIVHRLDDRKVYVALKEASTDQMTKKINERVNGRLNDDGHMIDIPLEYLLVNITARVGCFYLLPELHRNGCPGRPVNLG